MKYTIPIHRTEAMDITVFAESHHEALTMVRENHQGWHADCVSRIEQDPDEPEGEVVAEDWSVVGGCEGCGKPILTGDKYFAWEDCQTCMDCGGADESHKPLTA